MKKSIIWILTIVMALTFAGLLYMQVLYLEEIIGMREQHFEEGAKRSLYSLSAALEQNETKKYLEEDLMVIEPSIFDNTKGNNIGYSGNKLEDYKLKNPHKNEINEKF